MNTECQKTMKYCKDILAYLLNENAEIQEIIETLLTIETELFRARIKLERTINQ